MQRFLHVLKVSVFIQVHSHDYSEISVVLFSYFRQLLL
jgi:hypothetical protein